jgi:hypothetical protein
MAQGAFIVSPHPPEDPEPRGIMFRLMPGFDGPVPDDQLALQDAVDRALVVLEALFPHRSSRFIQYYRPLLSLAQAGLVGPHAQPELGRRALAQLQDQVVAAEGANVKNRYMKQLGLRALALGLPALVAALTLRCFGLLPGIEAFLYVWAAAMAGVWLSFGSRKTVLGFFDLHILEEDRLEPTLRLVFAGFLAIIVGLLFSAKMATVSIGELDLSGFESDVRLALLLGVGAGLSEKLLSQSVAKRAADMMSF